MVELIDMLNSKNIEDRMDALWALYVLSKELKPDNISLLRPAIGPLLNILSSQNRWARDRAAKILANMVLRADFGGEILEEMLEWLDSSNRSRRLGALIFFGYYFLRRWDDDIGTKIIDRLKAFLKDKETRFDALLTLEAVVGSIPCGKAPPLKNLVPALKELKESESPEIGRICIRILEAMAEKDRSLVVE
ncbi:HEAT repeat domain-containing protein [Pyrococcus yayanosii]|uniref:hypothetical protein n=1 Tax=Pyrococcus yayanosii TaxID=1008460 RepID=UPI0011D1B910|nr:hypothetical protein [Pyrococcus yayanosii]